MSLLNDTGSLDPDELARAKRTKDRRLLKKTYRFDIPLDPTGARYEYNFLSLVAEEEAKELNAAKSAFDPAADASDEETAALVKRLEEKYNKVSSGIRKRKKQNQRADYADLGYGYDSNDTFIDNTDQYDEVIPDDLTTIHGGFYINSGLLEFRALETVDDSVLESVDDSMREAVDESSMIDESSVFESERESEAVDDSAAVESEKKAKAVKRRRKEENGEDEAPKKKSKKLKSAESSIGNLTNDASATDPPKKKKPPKKTKEAALPQLTPEVATKMREAFVAADQDASLVVTPSAAEGAAKKKKVQKPRKPKVNVTDISSQSELGSVTSVNGVPEGAKKPKKPKQPKTSTSNGLPLATATAASDRTSASGSPQSGSDDVVVVDPFVIEAEEIRTVKKPRKPKAAVVPSGQSDGSQLVVEEKKRKVAKPRKPKLSAASTSGLSDGNAVAVVEEKRKIAKPRKPKNATSIEGEVAQIPSSAQKLNGEAKKVPKPRKPKTANAPPAAKTEDKSADDASDIIFLEAYSAAKPAAAPAQAKKATKPRKPKVSIQSSNNSLSGSLPGASSNNSLEDFQLGGAKPKKARVTKAKAAATALSPAASDRILASAWANASTSGKSRAMDPFVALNRLPKVANPLLAPSGLKPKNPLLSQASAGFSPPPSKIAFPTQAPLRPVAKSTSASAAAVQRLVASTPRHKSPVGPVPNFSPKEAQTHQHLLEYQKRMQQQQQQPNQTAGFPRPLQFRGPVASKVTPPYAAAKPKPKLTKSNSLTSLGAQNGSFRSPHAMQGHHAAASLHRLPNCVTVTSAKSVAQLKGAGAKQPKQTKATKQSQNVRPSSSMLNNSSSF